MIKNNTFDKCPICLYKNSNTIVCENKHKTCKSCIILYCLNNNDNVKCPICRDYINKSKFTLNNLDIPYNYNYHKLQHRYNDSSPWKNYNFIENMNIIIQINLSFARELTGGQYLLNNLFKIYWGDNVNISILSDTINKDLYRRQKTEIMRWKGLYGNNTIIQLNNETYLGLRLVRIV